MVLISVLIPSYNHGKFISETIESVLNQTFKNFEFIIIDDCSTDNSKEKIENYSKHDKKIKFYAHSENKGPSKTLNEAIKIAKGKFIAFLNSDDVWNKDKLEKQLKILKKDENLVVWSEGEIIDEDSRDINRKFTKRFSTPKKKSGYIFNELIQGNTIFFSSIILKKELIENIRFNEKSKFIADYPFELDLAIKYKYYFIEKPLAKYRVHSGNVFKVKNKYRILRDQIINKIYILEKYSTILPKEIRWAKLSELINYYFNYGKYINARPYIIKLILFSPFKLLNYWYFLKSHIRLPILEIFFLILREKFQKYSVKFLKYKQIF